MTMAAGAAHVAAIALGSNLGDRAAHLDAALASLAGLAGTHLLTHSRRHETRPVGPAGQGMYLNAAALLRTELGPRALLDELLRIERAQGRERSSTERWTARTLDLDLLVYGDLVIDEPGLTVPHPRLHARRFVLEPLAEIAPDLRVPPDGCTVRTLLERLGSEGEP